MASRPRPQPEPYGLTPAYAEYVRRQASPIRRAMRGLLLAGVLGVLGSGIGAAVAELRGRYVSKAMELFELRDPLKALQGVKAYFEANKARFQSLDSDQIQANPHGVARDIREATEEIEKAVEALRQIRLSRLRFNPAFFQGLMTQLNQGLRLMRGEKVKELHGTAECVTEDSVGGWVCNEIFSQGINTGGLVELSDAVRDLERALKGLKRELKAVSQDSVQDGCSNNAALDLMLPGCDRL